MGYSDKAAALRQDFFNAVNKRDLTAAKVSAVAYSRLMREIAQQISSYSERAVLLNEAIRYEDIAIALWKEGFSDRLCSAIFNKAPIDPSPSQTPATTPSTQGAQPTVLTPPPPHSTQDSGEWSADVFEKYCAATVVIGVHYARGISSGTGFFISDDGLILTNHHVAYDGSRPAERMDITSGDNKIHTTARIIAADKTNDVAILRIEGKRKTPFIPIIKDYSTVRAGIDVMIIGNGLCFGLAPVTGTLKFPNLDGNIVYTAQTNGGDSGSPLINRHGECIGIHKAREREGAVDDGRGARGIAYATPADAITKLLKKWQSLI